MTVSQYPADSVSHVTADVVFRAVKAVIASGREAEFLKLCAEKDYRLAADAQTANFVRGFLDQHARAGLDGRLTAAIEGDTCSC